MQISHPLTQDARPAAFAISWRGALATLVACLLIEIAAYWPTVKNAVHLWDTSSAYNYGFLIAPISLFLIWEDRAALRRLTPSTWLPGILGVLVFGAIWYVADLLGINEGRHVAFIGMMLSVVLFAFGLTVCRRLAFPLMYLWLMVPTGEFLIEPLQRISRDGSLLLLKAFAIPVFSEGWTIEVPSGSFVIEPGCSGLNFVLASLALSLLFGKLNFHRWFTRILCVVIALSVSVIANIARIFLIVAITQWTHRQIDIASDHLLYGWAFFGVVMMVCMWVGRGYAVAGDDRFEPAAIGKPWAPYSAVVGTLACAAIFIGIPSLARATIESASHAVRLVLPEHLGSWKRVNTEAENWRPGLLANDASARASYVHNGQRIDAAVAYFAAQHDGHEAPAVENRPVDPSLRQPDWREITIKVHPIDLGGRPSTAALVTLQAAARTRIVLYWYDSAGCATASRLKAKLCSARRRLFGEIAPGAFVIFSTEVDQDSAAAIKALDDFASFWPPADALVRRDADQ